MVSRDRLIGAGLVVLAVVVSLAYLAGLFVYDERVIAGETLDILLLKVTALIAVVGVMGILGWIGYTLATTPPPKPIEEIEKELEEELKKLEQEVKQGEGAKAGGGGESKD